MEQHIKRCIWDIIRKNTRGNEVFGDDEILLLQKISPIEYCGVLLDLQRIYRIYINDEAILGKELETVNSICAYIIHHIGNNQNTHFNTKSTDT